VRGGQGVPVQRAGAPARGAGAAVSPGAADRAVGRGRPQVPGRLQAHAPGLVARAQAALHRRPAGHADRPARVAQLLRLIIMGF